MPLNADPLGGDLPIPIGQFVNSFRPSLTRVLTSGLVAGGFMWVLLAAVPLVLGHSSPSLAQCWAPSIATSCLLSLFLSRQFLDVFDNGIAFRDPTGRLRRIAFESILEAGNARMPYLEYVWIRGERGRVLYVPLLTGQRADLIAEFFCHAGPNHPLTRVFREEPLTP